MRTSDAKNGLVIGKNYGREVLAHIKRAERSIYILMFDWRWYKDDITSDMSLLNQAILRASRNGVDVKILCHYDEMAKHLQALGFSAKSWPKTKLMHAKGILIDEDTLILGSHNLTENAMGLNIEVSAVLYDDDVCAQFKRYFFSLWQ